MKNVLIGFGIIAGIFALLVAGFVFMIVLPGPKHSPIAAPEHAASASGAITQERIRQLKQFEGQRAENISIPIGIAPTFTNSQVNGRHLAYGTYQTEDGRITVVLDAETNVVVRVLDGN